ncbi:hypothetical protein ACFRNJ_47875 [Streptomyces sp. NPDC056721]|uniref:hypothetical protein n=1 Tax=Streptomyces sp. NPDC056721 TaxID=3345923 RepID=UPI0036A04F15
MEPLPTPCPADRIPDATGLDAFEAACQAAKDQRVVFIAVERQGPRWAVKADALTALQHTVDRAVYDAVREAVILSHPLLGDPTLPPAPSTSTCTTWTTKDGPVNWPPCTLPSTATSSPWSVPCPQRPDDVPAPRQRDQSQSYLLAADTRRHAPASDTNGPAVEPTRLIP